MALFLAGRYVGRSRPCVKAAQIDAGMFLHLPEVAIIPTTPIAIAVTVVLLQFAIKTSILPSQL